MEFSLKSHPGILLKDHLERVNKIGLQIFEENGIFTEYKDLLNYILLLHDLGKASSEFQKYINREDCDNLLKSHSEISA